MKNKLIILFLLIGSICFSQEIPRSSKVILNELKEQITELKQVNSERENLLEEKNNTINSLNEKVQTLLTSLDNSVSDLSTANENIIKQNTKIKNQRKWLIILSSILGAFTIAHFVIIFLKLKYKITLPYWLNTLI